MPAMIAAAEPLAVEAGARVLLDGGNAMDAAVACAFVQGVVNPQMCGIGGYALALVQPAGAATPALMDAPATAGEHTTPEMWREKLIRLSPDGWGYFLQGKVNDKGYQSICTPGTVRGLATLLERYGTRSWADLIGPAASIAEEGFMVDSMLASRWKQRVRYAEACSLLEFITSNPEASRIYLKADGTPYDEGETLRNPDYARTLRRLAAAGPDDFYTGDLAHTMANDLAAHAAFVSAADLAAYAVRDEAPTVGTYRGLTISTSQAPHGGPTLIGILKILEGYDLARFEHNSPEYILLVAMAMKAAFADRNQVLGDPAFVDVPLELLTGPERAAFWRDRIDAGAPITVSDTPTASPDTTHVSVVDSNGMCVALTHSLGMSSGVITPGLGFMYNNSMVNFHPLPGHNNSIAPGKGRTTGMAPTILARDGQPMMVLGAPGASRIITAVLQVILNVVDFGMSVSDAVAAPRFDCQGDLIVCHGRIPEYVCAEVRRRHPIARLPQSYGAMALVHAIVRNAQGVLHGAADPGAAGMALRV